MPRIIELPDEVTVTVRRGHTITIDLNELPDEALVYACLYKFGGIADANSGDTNLEAARNHSQDRVDRLMRNDVPTGGGGGASHSAIWVAFVERVRVRAGWTRKQANELLKSGESTAAYHVGGLAIAVRLKGRKATDAQADAIAQALFTAVSAEVKARGGDLDGIDLDDLA